MYIYRNPKYTKDENGKELLTITEKHDNIMMEWEKPYMEACIEKLNPSGDILEIGFGLGYSATAIQNYSGVKKHTIIECSPEVWPKVEEFKKVTPITGIIMTKLDGTAKGGILLAIGRKFKLPIVALGMGEKEDDLQIFNAQHYSKALMVN